MKIYAYLMQPGAGFRIQRSHLKNNVAIYMPRGRKKKEEKKKKKKKIKVTVCPAVLQPVLDVLDVSS